MNKHQEKLRDLYNDRETLLKWISKSTKALEDVHDAIAACNEEIDRELVSDAAKAIGGHVSNFTGNLELIRGSRPFYPLSNINDTAFLFNTFHGHETGFDAPEPQEENLVHMLRFVVKAIADTHRLEKQSSATGHRNEQHKCRWNN